MQPADIGPVLHAQHRLLYRLFSRSGLLEGVKKSGGADNIEVLLLQIGAH
jgi:hypothetical protein